MTQSSNVSRLQQYMNNMCDALKIDCVCTDADPFVELSDMTDGLTYIVERGFLPLFEIDNTNFRYRLRQDVRENEFYTALSYYNFAFTVPVTKGKRKRNSENIFLFNNIQCILKKILDAVQMKQNQ